MQVTNSTRQRPVFLQDIHSCVLKSCSHFANDFAISASAVGALNTPVEYLTKHQLFQVETEASNMPKLQGKLHLSNKKHELSKTSRLQVEPVRILSSQTKTGGETDSPPVHKSTLVRAFFYPLGRDASQPSRIVAFKSRLSNDNFPTCKDRSDPPRCNPLVPCLVWSI
jgi:hypothetical protein